MVRIVINSLQYFNAIFFKIIVRNRKGGVKMAGIWNWLNSTKLFDNGQINLSVLKQLIDFLF